MMYTAKEKVKQKKPAKERVAEALVKKQKQKQKKLLKKRLQKLKKKKKQQNNNAKIFYTKARLNKGLAFFVFENLWRIISRKGPKTQRCASASLREIINNLPIVMQS